MLVAAAAAAAVRSCVGSCVASVVLKNSSTSTLHSSV